MGDALRVFRIVGLALLLAGCGKKSEISLPPGRPPQTPQAPSPAASGEAAPLATDPIDLGGASNPAAVLAGLTDSLRRYVVERRSLPASVEELAQAGYVRGLPPAPAGKRYAIDKSRASVVLVRK